MFLFIQNKNPVWLGRLSDFARLWQVWGVNMPVGIPLLSLAPGSGGVWIHMVLASSQGLHMQEDNTMHFAC